MLVSICLHYYAHLGIGWRLVLIRTSAYFIKEEWFVVELKTVAVLDGEWKAVEGVTAAEKAAMRFFKVVVVP